MNTAASRRITANSQRPRRDPSLPSGKNSSGSATTTYTSTQAPWLATVT